MIQKNLSKKQSTNLLELEIKGVGHMTTECLDKKTGRSILFRFDFRDDISGKPTEVLIPSEGACWSDGTRLTEAEKVGIEQAFIKRADSKYQVSIHWEFVPFEKRR